jgi:hypothetical protein
MMYVCMRVMYVRRTDSNEVSKSVSMFTTEASSHHVFENAALRKCKLRLIDFKIHVVL